MEKRQNDRKTGKIVKKREKKVTWQKKVKKSTNICIFWDRDLSNDIENSKEWKNAK